MCKIEDRREEYNIKKIGEMSASGAIPLILAKREEILEGKYNHLLVLFYRENSDEEERRYKCIAGGQSFF